MNTIICSGAIIALYLSIFIITKKKRNLEDIFLFSFFLISSFALFISYLSFEYELEDFQFFLLNMDLLTTPLWYLYVLILITGKKFKKRNIIKYFIPFIFSSIYLSYIVIFLTGDEIDRFIYKPFLDQPLLMGMVSILELLVIPFYGVLILRLLVKHKKNIKEIFSYKKGIDLKWIYSIVALNIIGWLFIYVPYFLKIEDNLKLGLFLNSILIMIIGYYGIKQSSLVHNNNNNETVKYKKSSIDKGYIAEYRKRLLIYMESEKPFLDNELNIYKLAKSIDIPSHSLSQVFSIGVGKSFYDFVNEYRVEEFKRRIKIGQNKDYTLLAIAMDSGFNSKSSFNRVFKNITGKTPSTFVNSVDI